MPVRSAAPSTLFSFDPSLGEHAQNTNSKAQATRPAVPTESALRARINEWTVGLAGGLLEGAPIRLATEISRVVNDGENLHVLPIVTRGPTENVNDLRSIALRRKGAHVAKWTTAAQALGPVSAAAADEKLAEQRQRDAALKREKRAAARAARPENHQGLRGGNGWRSWRRSDRGT
jgi:hypothetical protein